MSDKYEALVDAITESGVDLDTARKIASKIEDFIDLKIMLALDSHLENWVHIVDNSDY